MTLLREIERHLRRHGTSPSRFGREAARDPRLIPDMRQGRRPGPRLRARIEAYMAEREAAPRDTDGGAAQ